MKSVIPYAEMMKVSDEELVLLTGVEDYSQAAAQLDMGPKLIAVTLGSEGVLLATRQRQEKVTGFKVQAVDTTGAGDSFWGGFLSEYLKQEKDLEDFTWDGIKNVQYVVMQQQHCVCSKEVEYRQYLRKRK